MKNAFILLSPSQRNDNILKLIRYFLYEQVAEEVMRSYHI